jgi:hypothetical protein
MSERGIEEVATDQSCRPLRPSRAARILMFVAASAQLLEAPWKLYGHSFCVHELFHVIRFTTVAPSQANGVR